MVAYLTVLIHPFLTCKFPYKFAPKQNDLSPIKTIHLITTSGIIICGNCVLKQIMYFDNYGDERPIIH